MGRGIPGSVAGRQSLLCFCAVGSIPHLPAHPAYSATVEPWGGTVTVSAAIDVPGGSDPFTYTLTINQAAPGVLQVNDIKVQTPHCTADIYSAVNDC